MCDAKRDRSGPGPAFWSRILYLLLTVTLILHQSFFGALIGHEIRGNSLSASFNRWKLINCTGEFVFQGIKAMNRKREVFHMKQLFQLDNHNLMDAPYWD
uniref:Uncharacterized protein n=1 Tax=Wuchereria bancrofti TaxID=6293 RepID=A0A1I8ES73_WUCBA